MTKQPKIKYPWFSSIVLFMGLLVVILSLGTDSMGQWDSGGGEIWRHLRLPRLILGMVVGAQLSLAGLLLQTYFRNPLAEPYVLGVSSGASLGNILYVVYVSPMISIPFGMEISGALGAATAIFCVLQIGRGLGLASSSHLILIGVAVGAGLHSLAALYLVQADPAQIRDALVWLMGSLAYKSWGSVGMCLPVFIVALILCLAFSRALDSLTLGEEQAFYLGVRVSLIRWICLGCGVLLAGSATAAVGVVGFVGLMAPNLVRLALQTHHRTMIPFTVCIGAILVPLADLTSRCIAPGREIPIGILTSLAGSVFFLLLLKKTLSKYRN